MKNIIVRLIIIIILIVFIFAFGKRTYSALYSLFTGQTNIETAEFSVKLNGIDINSTYDVNVNDIVWNNVHASSLTVAPGSSGVIELVLDTSLTDVALSYTISFTDKINDENKLLTITSLVVDGVTKVITNNEYSEVILLSELDTNKVILVGVSWINDDLQNVDDSLIGIDLEETEFLTINFKVEQYNG